LLRTLNLNSPTPYNQKPSLNLSFDTSSGSPDLSPVSVTSALLTPTDLSPARFFDLKNHPPYELGLSHPYLPQSSLLFESPNRPSDSLPTSHSSSYRSSHSQSSYLSSPNAFPFFEPFSEHPSPAPIIQSHYNSPPARRPEPSRGPLMEWHQPQQQQQFPTPAEWLRPDEKTGAEHSSGAVGHEEPLRSSFVYQPSAHEVRSKHLLLYLVRSAYMRPESCTSPSTSSPSFTRLLRRRTMSSSHVLSSPQTNRHLFSSNRSSRSPTLTSERRSSMLYAHEASK